jgi:starvation-inducible DNA-binding protein
MSSSTLSKQASTASDACVAALKQLLAESYQLFVKTHGYHWNVVGPQFVELHKLFEEQYNDLFEAVDEIAERVRALGAKAPPSFSAFTPHHKAE